MNVHQCQVYTHKLGTLFCVLVTTFTPSPQLEVLVPRKCFVLFSPTKAACLFTFLCFSTWCVAAMATSPCPVLCLGKFAYLGAVQRLPLSSLSTQSSCQSPHLGGTYCSQNVHLFPAVFPWFSAPRGSASQGKTHFTLLCVLTNSQHRGKMGLFFREETIPLAPTTS